MKSSIQTIMLVVVLVGLLGGVAFIRQWITAPAPEEITPAPGGADSEKPEQAVEKIFPDPIVKPNKAFEVHVKDHQDFAFANAQDQALEFGLEDTSCGCESLEILTVTPEEKTKYSQWPPGESQETSTQAPPWQPLKKDRDKTPTDPAAVIPGHSQGIVRLNWNGAPKAGSQRLSASVWFQAQGRPGTRASQSLEVLMKVVPPLQVYPENLVLPDLEPGEKGRAEAEFWCWSATRPQFTLTATLENPHPCLQCSVKPLNGPECQALENKLPAETKTKVWSAYRVLVEVRDRLPDGRQLDLGPYQNKVNFISGDGLEASATFSGIVHGEVRIVTAGNRDAIALGNFPSDEGRTQEVVLETGKPGLGLVLDEWSPPYLDVQLSKETGPAGQGATRWKLKVTVPRDVGQGVLPPESKVVLKTQDTHPRPIRIPVTGNAYRNR